MDNNLPGDGSPSDSSHPSYPPDPIIEAHRETAEHQHRDEHGRFIHDGDGQPPPNSPNPPTHPNIPLPVSFSENNKYSSKNDPPLVSVSVTNPITYLKLFLKRILNNEGIVIKIKPLTAIAMIAALSLAFGTGFNVAKMFFPTSSPILHRAITLQGTVQLSESGQYYLSLPDNTLWTLRPTNPNINLQNVINKQVLVKGNLTAAQNVVEVKEVLVFSPNIPNLPNNSNPATTSAQPIP